MPLSCEASLAGLGRCVAAGRQQGGAVPTVFLVVDGRDELLSDLADPAFDHADLMHEDLVGAQRVVQCDRVFGAVHPHLALTVAQVASPAGRSEQFQVAQLQRDRLMGRGVRTVPLNVPQAHVQAAGSGRTTLNGQPRVLGVGGPLEGIQAALYGRGRGLHFGQPHSKS